MCNLKYRVWIRVLTGEKNKHEILKQKKQRQLEPLQRLLKVVQLQMLLMVKARFKCPPLGEIEKRGDSQKGMRRLKPV